jgi:putative lipoprotein
MTQSFLSILVIATLAGCASNEPSINSVITGEASYRERIAVKPGTRFEVVLQDVSRADAPATNLGNFVIENAGNPPYAFSIAYNPADINSGHSYAVRATLRNGSSLIFTSDTVIPVINNGKVTGISINMIRVAPAQP